MRDRLLLSLLFGWLLAVTVPVAAQDTEADWTEVVRSSPYWVSQGVYQNIVTIRRWVLSSSGYCSQPDRHILFDRRGRFLGYIDNGVSQLGTQRRINDARASMAQRGKAHTWIKGAPDVTGYPFALACDQPHAELGDAISRYLGNDPDARLWGSWDDLTFASPQQPGNLHQALSLVVATRQAQQRLQLPPELPRYLAGQLLIESGGRARAHSAANARGILQLSSSALGDCGISPKHHWHRLAQFDCALKLMNQNARNLRPAFEQRFGSLPEGKRQRLFTLLLIQAYHGGAGRVEALLNDDQRADAARYFARHHDRFSAGDIAFGMIYHNLGRDRLGLASLYYVADVQLATEALCQTSALREDPLCKAAPE